MGQLACVVGHMKHVGRKPGRKLITQNTNHTLKSNTQMDLSETGCVRVD